MKVIKNFKPNLIQNNPKDGSFTREKLLAIISKKGGVKNFWAIFKKDGCRLQLGINQKEPVSRALKAPGSILVSKRFKALNELCLKLNIALDGEFYMHGQKFNAIFRFFSKHDVTDPTYRKRLEKEFKKDPHAFIKEYDGKTIDFLTTFHEGLKFWMFDGIIIDRPDLIRFEDRMKEIYRRLSEAYDDDENQEAFRYLEMPVIEELESEDHIEDLYLEALTLKFEGLVIVSKDHEYKFGRSSNTIGTIFKLKDDAKEYDGVIIDIEEGTQIKEGVERGVDNLGNSTTSQKKDDREPSGKAKGFVVQFEDKGTFTVGLRGFNDEAKAELLANKDKYIGKHFKYVAMPPVKSFPRHAYFDCWRDEK